MAQTAVLTLGRKKREMQGAPERTGDGVVTYAELVCEEQRRRSKLFSFDQRVLEEPSTFLILCCTIFLTSARATVR
jgi:hypothetical protein